MSRLLNRPWLSSTIVAMVMVTASSFAQDERGGDRGDRGDQRGGDRGDQRGGDRGDRGGGPGGGGEGFRGGFPGGEFPGGGFPGGGFRGGAPGGPGGFSPTDLLRRFDANGNGMIDPGESQGPAAFFLQRIASEVPGIDLAKPIPIDKLSQAMDRLRQQRESGRGDNNRGPSGDVSTAIEPLVPGFGNDELLPLAPGFGAEAEVFTVKVTDVDSREADERFRRYDSNGDGILDKDELARGRWSEDPLTYDRNHDGKLTLSELAVRYARRRVAEEAARSAQTAGNSNDPRASRDGGGDRFGFGRGGFGGGGFGGDGQDPRSSFSRRDGGGGDGAGSASQDGSRSASAEKVDTRKSYRVKTVTERLPKGLPEWFARSDANADGQVAMAEFSTSWSDSALKEFGQFDLNRDGMITPSEALSAVNTGAVRGSTSSPPPTTTASTSSPAPGTTASPTTIPQGAGASSGGGGEVMKIDPRYLAYYQKLLSKYDTNGDGALVVDEWKGMSRDPSGADSDGDGRIVVNELAVWSMKK